MSKSLYHENKQKCLLQAAWYSVTEVLNYESTWRDFYKEFPKVEVDIKIQKVIELVDNYGRDYDVEVEIVQFSIVTSQGHQEFKQIYTLDNFGVRCIDRFNYPEGFPIPDPAYFQYKYKNGIRPVPKKSREENVGENFGTSPKHKAL